MRADPLVVRRDKLIARLEAGDAICAAAEAAGEDATALNDFWIGLLRRYEQVEDALTTEAWRAVGQDRLPGVR